MNRNRTSKHQSGRPDLEDTIPNLRLEDTVAQRMRGLNVATTPNGSGYNPYDTFPNTSASGIRKYSDLKKLSEWIRAKRLAEQKQDEEDLPTQDKKDSK
jgi:hypothetical protein